MNNKYKNAMDKITLSDEMKKKITAAAAEKINGSAKESSGKIKKFPVWRMASLAACTVLVLIAAFGGNVIRDKDPISDDNIIVYVPSETEPSGTDGSTADNNNAGIDTPVRKNADTAESGNYSAKAAKAKITAKNSAEPSDSAAETEEPKQAESKQNDDKQMKNEGEGAPENILQSTPPQTDEEFEMSSPGGGGVMGGALSEELDIADIEERLGYKIKIPTYMPSGYEKNETSLMFDTMVQIIYTNDEDTICYRTEKTDGDISGDYNVYQDVKTEDIAERDVTTKGNGTDVNVAVWQEKEDSYSVSSQKGISEEEIRKIVEGVK